MRSRAASPMSPRPSPKLVFFLGADEVDFSTFAESFKVYIGHHGDKGAQQADVDPAGRELCREAGHLGQPRRPRPARRARGVPAGRCARGLDDPARALRGARARRCRSTASRSCARRWSPTCPRSATMGARRASAGTRRRSTPRRRATIAYPIKDFYLTNAICRASPTMQRCSAELLHGEDFAEAAE